MSLTNCISCAARGDARGAGREAEAIAKRGGDPGAFQGGHSALTAAVPLEFVVLMAAALLELVVLKAVVLSELVALTAADA